MLSAVDWNYTDKCYSLVAYTHVLLWNMPKGFKLKYVASNGIKTAPSESPGLDNRAYRKHLKSTREIQHHEML
jgi:hypothetical protein